MNTSVKIARTVIFCTISIMVGPLCAWKNIAFCAFLQRVEQVVVFFAR